MVDIRPKDLPGASLPLGASNKLIVDQDLGGVNNATPFDLVESVAPVASQAEAEIGANNVKRMTALRVKQSIASEVGVSVASYAAGKAGLSAVQPSRQVIAGAGTVGGGDLSADRTIALSPASIASLAKADTAVQPAITITAGTGLTGGGNLTANRTVALNAASIASLGKADTAIQAPGGSTGQILAKSSNTTNDVAWVSSESATAVSYGPQTLTEEQQSQARANIGAAGVLSGFRNKIINGDFEIAQRATSQTIAGFGSVDRWRISFGDGTGTVTRVENALNAFPNASTYHLALIMTGAAPSKPNVRQRIEGLRQFSGKKITVTFYAYSDSGSQQIDVAIYQVFGTGGSPSAVVAVPEQSQTVIAGSWQKVSKTFDIPSISGKTMGTNLDDCLQIHLKSPAGATYTMRYARISLVEGDATAEEDPFSPRHIQQELALCQRYYEKVTDRNWLTFQTGSVMRLGSSYAVTKRIIPTLSSTFSTTGGVLAGVTSINIEISLTEAVIGYVTPTAPGYGFATITIAADAEF